MKGTFPTDKFQGIQTPFYYYDTDLLRQTLKAINNEVDKHPGYHVHYAVKANANPKVLNIICQAGLGADCVSGGEIEAAINAGFAPSKIVYAGVGKSDWEINLGLDKDIFCFNVESIAELEVINELAAARGKVARVAFRINPNVGAHTHANITTGLAENKFGIAMQDMEAAIEEAAQMQNVKFVGLHFHIGSQILDMGDFEALCNRINELQDKLEKLKLREGQSLHFELGRAVVAQMGSLITRTLYVKQGTAKKFAIVDAGMTDLIRPALYQAYHKIENISSDEPMETYDVVGPICESSDVFAKAIDINKTKRGDLIALRSAGAYGEIMASQYNCRKLPKGYISEDL